MVSGKLGALTAALLLGAGAARADVSISSKPTSNMDCESGVCSATAQKAVLNVGDLQTMLAGGDVAVKTGTLAKDIDIAAPLTWSRTSRLTLDAQRSVTIKKPVTVAGTGALTIVTKDGNLRGDLYFVGKGSVTFWDTKSSLVVNGNSFTLFSDIKTLAAAMSSNPGGFYALASDYDAKQDGVYSGSPLPQLGRNGVFEGLGNTVSRFSQDTDGRGGFFSDSAGIVRDLRLKNIRIAARGGAVGGLMPRNHGDIFGCGVSGSINGGNTTPQDAGGLVGDNEGNIYYSHAAVDVSTGQYAGGLVGYHGNGFEGIVESYATGSVSGITAGGLVGYAIAKVQNSYATGPVNAFHAGGLEGAGGGLTQTSYAIGAITGSGASGGFFGSAGGAENDYWDIETSGTSQGCGSGQCTGVTGLTTEQFQSSLPEGFDRRIWGQSPKIANGFPYLLGNPPE